MGSFVISCLAGRESGPDQTGLPKTGWCLEVGCLQ